MIPAIKLRQIVDIRQRTEEGFTSMCGVRVRNERFGKCGRLKSKQQNDDFIAAEIVLL